MAKERNPLRDKAFELYQQSGGNMQNREIANILDIPEKTVSAWKSRDKWLKKNNAVLQNEECSTKVKKCSTTKKKKTQSSSTEQTKEQNQEAGFEEIEFLENDGLNSKQRIFCNYVARGLSGTQAYIRAYQVSYETANARASILLGNVSVKAEIDRLVKIMYADEFHNADMMKKMTIETLKDILLAPDDTVKANDKVKAAAELAKHFNMYETVANNNNQNNVSFVLDIPRGDVNELN